MLLNFELQCKQDILFPTSVAYCINYDLLLKENLDACVDLQTNSYKIQTFLKNVGRVLIVSIIYGINPINAILYSLQTGRKVPLSMNMVVDIFISLGSASFLYIQNVKFPRDGSSVMNDGSDYGIVKDWLRAAVVAVIVVIVFLWIKLIYFMSRTRTLGILI